MALAFGPSVTTDANAVTVLTVLDADKASVSQVAIINVGSADGSFSIDGGATFRFLPGGSARTITNIKGKIGVIQIKRSGAQNMSAIHGDML